MSKVKISQSMIKELEKWMNGEKCGHMVYQKYANKIYEPPSDAMHEGIYFEYMATGALPKSGEVPQPVFLKTEKREWTPEEISDYVNYDTFPGRIKTPPVGVDLSMSLHEQYELHKEAVFVESLAKSYRTSYNQAKLFKNFCKEMGIEILGTQVTGEKNGLVGTLDIHAIWDGREVTIDLKYSGLINNPYDDMGWLDLYTKNDRENQYRYHAVQSCQYTYIFDRPFFFWVFSSVNEGENIMIEMVHDELEISDHLNRASEAGKRWNVLSIHERAGVSGRPEYNTCQKCVLKEKCEYKTDLPIPKRVMR